MRKKIVKVPLSFFSNNESMEANRKVLQDWGIDPLFISNECEIIDIKHRKKHRLTMKRRSKLNPRAIRAIRRASK